MSILRLHQIAIYSRGISREAELAAREKHLVIRTVRPRIRTESTLRRDAASGLRALVGVRLRETVHDWPPIRPNGASGCNSESRQCRQERRGLAQEMSCHVSLRVCALSPEHAYLISNVCSTPVVELRHSSAVNAFCHKFNRVQYLTLRSTKKGTCLLLATLEDLLFKSKALSRARESNEDSTDLVNAPPDGSGILSLYPANSRSLAMVTLLGVSGPGRERIIQVTKRRLSWRYALVYVGDDPDFLPFRREKVPFEYLPSASERARHRPSAAWGGFLQQRYDLLIAKWRPRHVVAYGVPFAEVVRSAEAATGS